jgi:hypothetical protein
MGLHWSCMVHLHSSTVHQDKHRLFLKDKVDHMKRLHRTKMIRSKSDFLPNNQMMYTIHHSEMCQNTLVQNNNLMILEDRAASIESVHPQANYHRIEMVPTWEVVVVRAQAQEPHYYHMGCLQSNFPPPLDIRTLILHRSYSIPHSDMVWNIYMQHHTNLCAIKVISTCCIKTATCLACVITTEIYCTFPTIFISRTGLPTLVASIIKICAAEFVGLDCGREGG